jgi:hypothetical protein
MDHLEGDCYLFENNTSSAIGVSLFAKKDKGKKELPSQTARNVPLYH